MPQDNASAPLHLGALLMEGYVAPRQSMARVLAMRPDEGERLIMVGIGIAIGALGFAMFGERGETVNTGSVVLGYLVTILTGLFQYYVLARVIGFVARAAGGAGDQEMDRTLVAWWAIVTAPLPVVMMISLQNIESPLAGLFLLGSSILTMILLGAYIAQTHGFQSTARVCGAMIGILMLFSFVLTSLVPMPG